MDILREREEDRMGQICSSLALQGLSGECSSKEAQLCSPAFSTAPLLCPCLVFARPHGEPDSQLRTPVMLRLLLLCWIYLHRQKPSI